MPGFGHRVPETMFNEVITDPGLISEGCRTVTTFEDSRGKIFSHGKGQRKHMIAEYSPTSPDIDFGIEQYVRVKLDTAKGSSTGGVFLVESEGPTPWGEVQLQMREQDYQETESSMLTSATMARMSESEILARVKNILPFGGVNWKYAVAPFSHNEDGTLNPNGKSLWRRPAESNAETPSFTSPTTTSPVESAEVSPKKEVLRKTPLPIERIGNTDSLRILDLEIEIDGRGGKLTPAKEKFKTYTLDARTLQTLYAAASAYGRKSPLFLEGDTAVSKTSVIEFLASEVETEVRRVNVSGQVSTGDLIGRFIPNDQLSKVKYEKLIEGWEDNDAEARGKALKRFTNESQVILKKAYEETRPLSEQENIVVAHNEGLNISDSVWVWKNGAVPEAMIKGQILILDEITLGEPQIMERLNSVLERCSSLVLDENGGLVIGPGGDFAVHEKFWVVATGNFGGMEGRRPLTAAALRRYRDYEIVTRPTKGQLEEMLIHMVTGKQPEVVMGGVKYQGEDNDNPPFADLAGLRNVGTFMKKLANTHLEILGLSEPGVDEQGNRTPQTTGKQAHREGGKYVYTRETLVTVLERMTQEKILDVQQTREQGIPVYSNNMNLKLRRALEAVYVNTANSNDRKAISDQLEAAGLYGFFK